MPKTKARGRGRPPLDNPAPKRTLAVEDRHWRKFCLQAKQAEANQREHFAFLVEWFGQQVESEK